MELVGVVAEYNPFHAGHRQHLRETRRALGGQAAVAVVMSGNFVQRGDCAIDDKWSRAAAALAGGADLVLELPTVWACASAEGFAQGAVAILREAGAQALSFGSESGDAAALAQAARALDSVAYRQALRGHLDRGLPFARCRHLALQQLLGEAGAACLARPNDNLGVEYLRAARSLDFHPRIVAVVRAGAGHDGGAHPDYPSASWLRERIYQGALPLDNPAGLRYNERGILSRLRQLDPDDFAALPDCGEGLDRRLYRAARQAVGLEQLYELAKSKRYAHARIRRCILWACLGLKAADRPDRPPYLRVLGANGRGIQALKACPSQLPVITKPAHGKGIPLLELESRCTDFYNLCRLRPQPCGAEWTTSPVIRPEQPGERGYPCTGS